MLTKEWIEKAIKDRATEHIVAPIQTWTFGPEGIAGLASAIAQAAEEDKWGALETIRAADHEIGKEQLAEIDRLRAQVAVMAKTLQDVAQTVIFECADGGSVTCRHVPVDWVEAARQALSTAPKVLYSGEAPIYRTGEGTPWLDLTDWKYGFVNGMIYDILILECLRHPEQGQNSEQVT